MFRKIFQIIIYIFAIIGFILVGGFFAVKYGLTNTKGIIDEQQKNFIEGGKNEKIIDKTTGKEVYYWQTLPEWQTIKAAVIKDQAVINRASLTSGVSPRLVVTGLVVEQLRLFYTERESYKKFFEPLKILGSQTQFSWGVMGMKEETAILVEKNLKDKASPFYLGEQYENLLNFQSSDIKQERFIRMTDQHNHYFSYLYAGLYLKQIQTQWKVAGYDISKKADVMATLYNIGFNGSKPNSDPKSGGAEIKIGEYSYSFGSLGKEFYESNELLEEFPR